MKAVKLTALPKGWRYIGKVAPVGWKWASNGKSKFDKAYRAALVMQQGGR